MNTRKLNISFCCKMALPIFAALAIGCSNHSRVATQRQVTWLNDGMIAISRPLPAAANSTDTRALAFMPVIQASHSGTWLSINTVDKSIRLMNGGSIVASTSGDGVEKITHGTFQLLHKQRNALWYAPDSYFSSRNLPIPPQGDKSRFRRGALGDFVLYINKDTPIHSGPFWTSEIGGIKLEDAELSRIYYQLPVGAEIEIQ